MISDRTVQVSIRLIKNGQINKGNKGFNFFEIMIKAAAEYFEIRFCLTLNEIITSSQDSRVASIHLPDQTMNQVNESLPLFLLLLTRINDESTF
jgi:hypothetical protein